MVWHEKNPRIMGVPFVLSIEDSEGDFTLLSMALHECLDAVIIRRLRDGEEALAFFQELVPAAGPDLVLLDLNLPCRDGFDVLTFMKSIDELRDIPVVMFTSSTRPYDREKALSLGANEYVTKGMSIDTIMAQIKGLCARYLLKARQQEQLARSDL